MKTVLIINTSLSEKICVGIKRNGKLSEKQGKKTDKSQMVLPMIEELLELRQLKLSDITEIEVNAGPGSYTGLRVGVAIANMLGALLGVPVNGLPVGQTVTPIYEGDRW